MTRARAAGVVLGATTAAAVGALAWGVFVERTRFTVRHEVLPILEPGARSLTILHLSDLHMAPWQRKKQDFVRSLARYEPDLIVDTGDNLGHVDGLTGIRRAFEPFHGIPGVFAHGSNDYHGPVMKNPFSYFGGPSGKKTRKPDLDVAALNGFLTDDLGWLDLNNTARALETRGHRIELFGTGDAHLGWDRLDALPGAVEALREEVEWDDDGAVLKLGVTHAPYRRVLEALTTQGADLILAGHTHGGQVRIPGLPALVTNCDIPRHQAQGLSVWDGQRHSALLNVSAGLGTSIYAPVRFACAPEAVVLTLVPVGYP
ncbi:MAG: metallophosphoesterase [Pseudolysinimonas sp.]|uniref:metallophosphoesterase n=1 Tax=Pseudolysinimonas sp. TaxID=2680009 RepID=UPI003C757916